MGKMIDKIVEGYLGMRQIERNLKSKAEEQKQILKDLKKKKQKV